MISDYLNLDKKDKYYLAFITILSTIITIYYINFFTHFGIFCSDVYVYLVNALTLSGHNIANPNSLWLSPVICFLTSLLFDIGLVNNTSIFIVTGCFAIIGNIGLYLLMRLKFDKLLSCLAVVIYTTFSLNLIWLANGTLDIPAVSLTIWFVLFFVIGIKKDPKYYIYSFLMFLLAFFTRYTVVLVLPALAFYFISEKQINKPTEAEKKYFKYFLVIAAIAIVIIFIMIIAGGGQKSYLFNVASSMLMGNQGTPADPAYNTNLWFYSENFINFLSSSNTNFYKNNPDLQNPTIISYLYLAILIVGGAIAIKDNSKIKLSKKYAPIAILLITITSIAFLTTKSTYTIILLFITFLVIWKVAKKFDFNMMMVLWALTYFIFFSYLHFKVNRYFIPILPVVSYFIVYGIYKIQNKINIDKRIIPIALMIVLVAFSFAYTETVEDTNKYNEPLEATNYIISHDPEYKHDKLGVYNNRPYKWYFRMYVNGYKTNEIDKISNSNASYYISDKNQDIPNFTQVKHFNSTYIYKNNKIT